MPDLPGPLLDNFHLAADPQMSRVRAKLEALARNSIRIWPELTVDDDIPIGSTKLGGLPDLPPDVEWPWYHVEMPRPSAKYLEARPDILVLPEDGNVSLPFIGQFDLAELASYDLDGVLPKTGILYLFYNDEQYETDVRSKPTRVDYSNMSPHERLMRAMEGKVDSDDEEPPGSGYYIQYQGRDYFTKVFGYENPGKVRAIYSKAPKDSLIRREMPLNIATNRDLEPHQHNSCRLKFTTERLLPRGEDNLVECRGDGGIIMLRESEYAHWQKLNYKLRANVDINQMLGYPDMYSHGPGLPEFYFPLPRPWPEMSREEKIARGREHRLILQLDLQIQRLLGCSFGRSIFFCIRNHDLARGDFSKVWLDMS